MAERRQTILDAALSVERVGHDLQKLLAEALPLLEAAHDDVFTALNTFGGTFTHPEGTPQAEAGVALENAQAAIFTVLSLLDPDTAADVATMEASADD